MFARLLSLIKTREFLYLILVIAVAGIIVISNRAKADTKVWDDQADWSVWSNNGTTNNSTGNLTLAPATRWSSIDGGDGVGNQTRPYLRGSSGDAAYGWVVGADSIGNELIKRRTYNLWEHASTSTSSELLGVYAPRSNFAVAVGFGGRIVIYNGTSWVGQNSGTTKDLYSVSGTSLNNIYAVGDGGTILHFDGSSWSAISSPTGINLTSINLDPLSNTGWAVGSGVIVRYDNGSWSLDEFVPKDTSDQVLWLSSVYTVNASSAYAVSSGPGYIFKYNNGWVRDANIGNDSDALMAVWADATRAIVVGKFGKVFVNKNDGLGWVNEKAEYSNGNITDRILLSINAVSSNDFWITNDFDEIFHFITGNYPAIGVSITSFDSNNIDNNTWWTNLSKTDSIPSGTNISYKVKPNSDNNCGDGSGEFSGWTDISFSGSSASLSSIGRSRYLCLATVLTSSDSQNTPSIDALTLNYSIVQPDFNVSLNKTSLSMSPDKSDSSIVATISPTNGFDGDISLSLENPPSGISGSFSPAIITEGSGTSILTLNVASGAAIQDYELLIKSVSGTTTNTKPLTLTVNTYSYSITNQVVNPLCSITAQGELQNCNDLTSPVAKPGGTLKFKITVNQN